MTPQTRSYVGASIIAAAGIIFWVFAMPLYDGVAAARSALADRKTLLDGRAAIMVNVTKLTKEYSEHADEIQRFADVVPPQKSTAELISAIQALATQNGLQLTALALGSSQTDTEALYQNQSLDIGLNGTYPAFKSFLTALEKNIRIIDLQSVDASPTGENSPIISFRIKGTAYYLK